LTGLAIDWRGRLVMTSVVDLEYWKPLTHISDARFPPGAALATCKQTDDILTALAVDRDGRLQVASVARVGFWNPPVGISDAVFPPGSPVAMAKQTDAVLTALAVDQGGRLRVASVAGLGIWKPPVGISLAVFAPGSPVAMAKQTPDVLTALAVDTDGRLRVTSVAGLGTWNPPVGISDPVFLSPSPVAMAKQTDDVLTGLAVDKDGRLRVVSVAGLGIWNPPVGISDPVFLPASPVAMAKQTGGVLTALAVDKDGRLRVASVGGLGTWQPPVAISDPVFVPGTPVTMAKQTRDVLTALAVDKDGGLRVMSVAGLGTWKPPVLISDRVLTPKGPVAMAKQVDGVDLATYLGQQPAVSGSAMTQRIAQLTGGFDPEFHDLEAPVNRLNQTAAHGVRGVDLGTNAELDGRLFFFFGDVPTAAGRPDDQSDWVAHTSDQAPSSSGVQLTSVDRPNSTEFQPFTIRGIGPLGRDQTPTGAFAYAGKGSDAGRKQMFVFAFYNPPHPGAPPAGSVLTKSAFPERGVDFDVVFSFSTFAAGSGRFFQVAPWVIRNADVQPLPRSEGDGVILMGHGGPANEVHLAWMPLTPGQDPDKSELRFYRGRPGDWSDNEAEAITLFPTVGYTSLSLSWLPGPRRWLLLYSLASPRALGRPNGPGDPGQHNPNGPIVARFGETPWSWSSEIIIFDPLRDNALGRFMHRPGSDTLDLRPPALPHNPAELAYDGMPGYAYGPFNLSRYTRWNPQNRTVTLHYFMSTFAPYQVQLMRSLVEVP
jgi:hypothetical protein